MSQQKAIAVTEASIVPSLKRLSMEDAPPIAGEVIRVLVGDSKQSYTVDKALLGRYSPVFKNALAHTAWAKRHENEVTLPDCDPQAFNVYIEWLHRGRTQLTPEDTLSDEHGEHLYLTEWAKIYALGDHLQDIDFKDAVIDVLLGMFKHNQTFPKLLPGYIYPYSGYGSPHRKLVIDVFMAGDGWSRMTKRSAASELEGDPKDFLVDLIFKMSPLSSGRVPIDKYREAWKMPENGCEYHEHVKNGSDCYKTKLQSTESDGGESVVAASWVLIRKLSFSGNGCVEEVGYSIGHL